MSAAGTYFRVGLFVLLSMVLIVLGVIIFGVGLGRDRASTTFETYMDSSVQGLEVGSKVRNLGVEVGQVKQITFIDAIYDVPGEFMLKKGRWVLIRLTLFDDRMPQGLGVNFDKAVEDGMRVRITSSGFTGGKYLEIDQLDPERNPVKEVTWTPKKPHIPSAPSAIAKIVESVDKLSQTLEDAPVDEILVDTRDTVAGLRESVGELDVKGLTERAEVVLDDLHLLLRNPNIPVMLANFREASENANTMIARLNTQTSGDELTNTLASIEQASAKLPDAMTDFARTLKRVEFLLLDRQGDLNRSTHDLRVILDDFREFMATGKEYPSWTVFGDPPRPIEIEPTEEKP